jgi:hypothetical protein
VFAAHWWWHDVTLTTSVFSFKNQATILVGRGASTKFLSYNSAVRGFGLLDPGFGED